MLRARAIDAGHRVSNTNDKRRQLEACQKYRACVQKKRREHKNKCLAEIEAAYTVDKNNLWKVIDRLSGSKSVATEPSDSEFFNHFNQLSNGQALPTFSVEYEAEALAFFNKYDASNSTNDQSLESMIINDNFTANEVETAIDKLKNNKSPGIDHIPAEIIKQCRMFGKHLLTDDIAMVLNYIIQYRNFPQTWTEGLRSAVLKAGTRTNTNNYRGVTVLPVIEKIFEIIVYRRMSFPNEIFNKIDVYNGGFLADSRTFDNMFILQGLIQRQLCLGTA